MSVCRILSCVVRRGCLLWPVHSLGKAPLSCALLHFVHQGQTYLLLHVSFGFLLLHSSLWWKTWGWKWYLVSQECPCWMCTGKAGAAKGGRLWRCRWCPRLQRGATEHLPGPWGECWVLTRWQKAGGRGESEPWFYWDFLGKDKAGRVNILGWTGLNNSCGFQAKRVLPRERTGQSKHPLPTTQEMTLYMDITR